MSARLHPDDVEAVLRASRVADVGGDHTRLAPGVPGAPGELRGRCPLPTHGALHHPDEHPRGAVDDGAPFAVRPSPDRWRCRGCGCGGDVVELVTAVRRCSWAEAVEELAARAGVRLRRWQG